QDPGVIGRTVRVVGGYSRTSGFFPGNADHSLRLLKYAIALGRMDNLENIGPAPVQTPNLPLITARTSWLHIGIYYYAQQRFMRRIPLSGPQGRRFAIFSYS